MEHHRVLVGGVQRIRQQAAVRSGDGKNAEDVHLTAAQRAVRVAHCAAATRGDGGRGDSGTDGGHDYRAAAVVVRLIEGDAAAGVGGHVAHIHLAGASQHRAGGRDRGERQRLHAAAEAVDARGGDAVILGDGTRTERIGRVAGPRLIGAQEHATVADVGEVQRIARIAPAHFEAEVAVRGRINEVESVGSVRRDHRLVAAQINAGEQQGHTVGENRLVSGEVARGFNSYGRSVVDADGAGSGLSRGAGGEGGDGTVVTEAQRSGIDHDSTREGAGSIIEHERIGPEFDDVVAC